jgi:hypothetical protein
MKHKDLMANTYHKNGTVIFWSVYQQVWIRERAERISDREIAAMAIPDRDRIRRMTDAWFARMTGVGR